MFSVIDPKGSPPKIRSKSHSFSFADQHSMLLAEFESKVWPALTLVPVDLTEKA